MNCLECQKKLKTDNPKVRNHKYCNITCRNRFYYKKFNRREEQKQKRDKEAMNPENKIQCLMCERWYRQVGSHIVQVHKMTAREYREYFDLEVKKGLLPKDLKELYGEQALENGTWKNLKKGTRYWFVKGDKRAGRYHRSYITMKRLKNLHKLKVAKK